MKKEDGVYMVMLPGGPKLVRIRSEEVYSVNCELINPWNESNLSQISNYQILHLDGK